MRKITFNQVHFKAKMGAFLEDISLVIETGDLFMIKDPSIKQGELLLSLIHQFVYPQKGTIDIAIDSDDYIGSNIIPFIEHFSVREVLSLSLLTKGYSKKEIKERILQITSYFSIEKLVDKKIKKLSMKEKALISLSKAVIGQPSIVLLTSFTQYLDHQLAVLVLTYLHEISIDHNVTVVMIENDIKLHPFAGKILHLEEGKIKDLVGEGVNLEKLMPLLKI